MKWLIGVRTSWFQGKLPGSEESAVVSFTRRPGETRNEAFFINALDFFRPDQFPHATHTPIRLAVTLIEVRDNSLLRTRVQDMTTWSIFTRVPFVDSLYLHGDSPYHKREALAWQTSSTLEDQFGDLMPMFNPHMLHKALPLNDKQIFLWCAKPSPCLYLGVWLYANRDLLCPEPHFDTVEWMLPGELVRSVILRPQDYDTLSQVHLTCPISP